MQIQTIIGLIILLLGLIMGSFVNAWVWRTRQETSINKGRSMCPRCKHQLYWRDLLPLVSFIALRGKCRYCHKAIDAQYPLVELITALLFVVLYWSLAPGTVYETVQLIIILAISVLLVGAFVYDARYMELPEKFMLPAIALGMTLLGLKALQQGWNSLTGQLVGLAVVILLYTAMWYFSRGKWLGAGDIRLVAIMGLLLAPASLIVGIFIAYLIGAVYGIYVLQKSKVKRGVRIPFGPFLIIGLYVGLLWGQSIASWYLSFIILT